MRRPPSRTTLIVAAILTVALAVRLIEVESTSYRPVNDAGTYLGLASQIAHTGNYTNSRQPGVGAGGSRGPSAYFPPGLPYFLAVVDLLDGQTHTSRVHGHTRIPAGAVHGARISQAVLGTVTVALVGLLALEGLGPLVALIAMALAALYPVLIGLSGTVLAENLATTLILATLWTALRARRSPHPLRWLAGSGALAGLATLTHVNAIVVIVPLALIAWGVRPARGPSAWRALAAPGLVVGCLLITLTPWLIRNAIVMHRFIWVTDEAGITLVGTYNSASAANPGTPYAWRPYSGIPADAGLAAHAGRLTETQLSDRLFSQARHYIVNHPFSPLKVAYYNSRRLLELEGSRAWRASARSISLSPSIAHAGVVCFWLLCLVALAGAFTRATRAAWRWLWVTPVLLWLTVAFVNAETPRFRESVDPFLILFAACALAVAWRWAEVRLRRAPVAGGGVGPLPAGASERVEVG